MMTQGCDQRFRPSIGRFSSEVVFLDRYARSSVPEAIGFWMPWIAVALHLARCTLCDASQQRQLGPVVACDPLSC